MCHERLLIFLINVTKSSVYLREEAGRDGIEEFAHDMARDNISVLEQAAIDVEYLWVCYGI